MIVNEYLREHYMLPMDHPIAVENMRRHSSKAEVYENFFEPEELESIWKQAFKNDRNPRMNRNGTVLIADKLEEIYFQYKERIDKALGETAAKSPSIGGNYFITPQQYGLHNDSIRPQDYENTFKETPLNHERRRFTCWKNFLIPLWIGTHHDEVDGGQIVFFNQRHIDWAHVYNGGNKTPNIASVYKISTDYTDLQFHDGDGNLIPKEDNAIPFDQKMHKLWMNTPYERLQGLSLEKVVPWKPTCAMSFDATQLHASNEGTKASGKKMWNSKMGLLLTYLIELDDDLLEEWRAEQAKM
jgi:hypothetical protein